MSIFGFGKKKSESKVASCGCGGVCTAQQEIKPDQIKADINSIRVLGPDVRPAMPFLKMQKRPQVPLA